MLPPRSEIQALEDDILKQVRHQQQYCSATAEVVAHALVYRSCKRQSAPQQAKSNVPIVFLQMQVGMERANASQILMLPTYVTKLPTG
jgi:hypothetical protein